MSQSSLLEVLRMELFPLDGLFLDEADRDRTNGLDEVERSKILADRENQVREEYDTIQRRIQAKRQKQRSLTSSSSAHQPPATVTIASHMPTPTSSTASPTQQSFSTWLLQFIQKGFQSGGMSPELVLMLPRAQGPSSQSDREKIIGDIGLLDKLVTGLKQALVPGATDKAQSESTKQSNSQVTTSQLANVPGSNKQQTPVLTTAPQDNGPTATDPDGTRGGGGQDTTSSNDDAAASVTVTSATSSSNGAGHAPSKPSDRSNTGTTALKHSSDKPPSPADAADQDTTSMGSGTKSTPTQSVATGTGPNTSSGNGKGAKTVPTFPPSDAGTSDAFDGLHTGPEGVAYRWEEASSDLKVLVLVPNAEQFAPLVADHPEKAPALVCAERLGAERHGVFKVVVPEESRPSRPRRTNRKFSGVSKYSPTELEKGMWRLIPSNCTAKLDRASKKQVEDLIEHLERNNGRLPGVLYRTDTLVESEEERVAAGLPKESIIKFLCNNQLKNTRRRIGGIHTPSAFEGFAGAPFGWHRDSAQLDAVNYLHQGCKRWYVIAPEHTAAAEARFRQLPPREESFYPCAHFMNIESVFGISALKGITPVRSFVQNEGELVAILNGAYHSGFSKTYTISETRNWARDCWQYVPPCDAGIECPCFPHYSEDLQPLGPGETQEDRLNEGDREGDRQDGDEDGDEDGDGDSDDNGDGDVRQGGKESPPKKRRQTSARSSETRRLARVVEQVRLIDPKCHIPSLSPSEKNNATAEMAEVVKVVMATTSRTAIQAFCALVQSWREEAINSIPIPSARRTDATLEKHMIERHSRVLSSLMQKSRLIQVQKRIVQVHLFSELDKCRVSQGRTRASKSDTRRLRDLWGLNLKTMEYHVKLGKCWKRICGSRDGLLCFLPFPSNEFGIPMEIFEKISSSDKLVQMMHNMLDSCPLIKDIAQAGRALQVSMMGMNPDAEFAWEKEEKAADVANEMATVSDTKLRHLLKHSFLYSILDTSIMEQIDPPPPGWSAGWPGTAAAVSPGEIKCQECGTQRAGCDCIERPYPFKIRIRHYGARDRGLQVLAEKTGDIACRSGSVVGYLAGWIIPVGTDGRWTSEAGRKVWDLVKSTGSLFCLIQPSQDPNVRMGVRRISAEWWVVLEAAKDILDGSEITLRSE